MIDPLTNMRTGWWSFSLPGYREHPDPTTYNLFSYERLPRLKGPRYASWDWLASQPSQDEWSLAGNAYPEGAPVDPPQLRALLAQIPFEIPAAFVSFLETPSLHTRVRSCTACRLELSDFPVYTSAPPRGVIIQFLVDQQGVLRWYLFADSFGNQAVLCSGEIFGFVYEPEEEPLTEIDLFKEDFRLCAASFQEFIYRFWLENEVWFSLNEGQEPTNPEQIGYLKHYR
jgi:hypothetical protein